MRESIGNAYIFNIVLVFVAIIISLLVGSMSYSKTFKVKNRILEIIEKYDGYTNDAKSEIDDDLRSIGYRINRDGSQDCPTYNGANAINTSDTNHRYCVYQFSTPKGNYYAVSAYMYMELPLFGGYIEYPIYGETPVDYNLE